jgi:hypothetical protein
VGEPVPPDNDAPQAQDAGGYDSLLNATILPVLDDVPIGKLHPIIVQEWLESEPVIPTHDQVSALVA